MYHAQINEYFANGQTKKNLKSKMQWELQTSLTIYYIIVCKCKKIGKIWAVLYVSAKHQYTSLNDSLLPGPDLLNSPVLVLVKLRHGKYVVIADKKRIFLEINIKPLDINLLRLIWWRKPEDNSLDHVMYEEHVFGEVDSSHCTNWRLRKVTKYRFRFK